MSNNIDISIGVTRNPWHPQGKAAFAINFDDLKFTLDGELLETADVLGVFPSVRSVLLFKRDEESGDILYNKYGRPESEVVRGDIEIEGVRKTCGCSMTKFQVARWWEVTLTEGG